MPAANLTLRPWGCILFVTLFFAPMTALYECANAAVGTVPVVQDPDEDDKADDKINEQTIYIPYDKLRDIFERDGRGVFLPYEEFQKLWTEARKRQPKPADTSAPLGALITDIESVASLGQEIVTVDATLKIELLRKGWHRIPLRLADAAIRSAKIGNDPARVVSTKDGPYELLIEHDGDQPVTITLLLSYAKALDKTRGQSTVSFQSPQAPVNRWTIRTGQKDIEVEIEPMIAASKKEGGQGGAPDNDAGDEILAFVGAAPQVLIRWTPKSEGASGLAALMSVQNQQQTQIDQGVARTRANLVLDISRAEIKQLQLVCAADQKVVNVFDRNVKKWEVRPDDAKQIISIEFFEAAIGSQSLSVELEKFMENMEAEPIEVPQIEVVDASRNQGVLLIELADGLRAEPAKKTGLLQMDKSELPAALAKQDWRFAYRYASLPFDLSLNVTKIQPLINAGQLVEIAVRPEQISVDMAITYDIRQAGVFQLLLDIPQEFEIRDIRPLARKDLAGAPVDSFYRDPANENRWIVTLSSKATGKIGLAVSLKRDLDDPNLLSPTGQASDIEITVPKVATDGIEFSSGYIVVYAPESLQINAADTKGVRNESFANALSGQSSAVSTDQSVRGVLAYGFSHSDAALTLQAKRRRPQVTADQLLVVTIESGVVKYDARFFYDVRFSGVKSLRLDVPTPLVGLLRNRSDNILQQAIQPQPADVPEGYTAWQLTGENEFFGRHEIRYTWEEKTEELPVGESTTISVPRLVPMNVDRAGGQIVTTKSETIDLQPAASAKGLRPIDPQTDLIPGTSVDSAAMAFEFVDDWSLALTATRFVLEDLKRTSISRSVIRVVALRQNELSVQALYQVRSVDQRLAIQMPAGFDSATSFDDQPIRVNGVRVTPERGGKNLIYVPLTDQNPEQAFLLELRYSVAGNHRDIQLPTFPDDPAVQKVYLCVYLPYEQALLHKSGPWTDEAIEVDSTLLNRMFNRRRDNVQDYLNWVTTGIDQTISQSQQFETDGRPYVFTALRPEAPPAGAIHLRTLNLTLLNVIVCGAIVLIGLLLIGQRLTTQLAAVVLLLVVTVLAGIFFPLVTEHLLGQPLLLTLGSVALVWMASDTGRWIRARSVERQQRHEAALIVNHPVEPEIVQDADATVVEPPTTQPPDDSDNSPESQTNTDKS